MAKPRTKVAKGKSTRRRCRKVWLTGTCGISLPTDLRSCSVHAYRRAVEESDAFAATRASAVKLVRATRQVPGASEGVAFPEFEALAKAEQKIKDLCWGVYGFKGPVFDEVLEQARSEWIRRETGREVTEEQKNARWRRLQGTIRHVAATARRRIVNGVVWNADVARVEAYIDAHSDVAIENDENSEFASQRERDFEEIKGQVFRPVDGNGARDVQNDTLLSNRLRRVVWGFATKNEAESVAEECAKSMGGEDAERVSERIRETHAKAADAVKNLNRLGEIVEVGSVLVSRLETLVSTWFTNWQKEAGGVQAVWASHYLQFTPDKAFSAAMKLVAGDVYFGEIPGVERLEATVQVALEGAVGSQSQLRGKSAEARERAPGYLDRARAHRARLQNEVRDEFNKFVERAMLDKFPFLLEAERDADGKMSFKKQKILQSDMLDKAAARWVTNSQTAMRVQAKRRWKKLISAEVARLQAPEFARGLVQEECEANAAAMRRFLCGAKRRKRLVEHLSHKLRWLLSPGYESWCTAKKIKSEPTKKLAEEAIQFGIAIQHVTDDLLERVKTIAVFSDEQTVSSSPWPELVSVISRTKFESDKTSAAPYDALAIFTNAIGVRVQSTRQALLQAFGRREPSRQSVSVFDRDAVRRFGLEKALEKVLSKDVSPFQTWMTGDATARQILNGHRMKRVLNRAVRNVVGELVTLELQMVGRNTAFGGDADDLCERIAIHLQSEMETTADAIPIESNAKAASRILRGLSDVRESIGRQLVLTMKYVRMVIANVRGITDAAIAARTEWVDENLEKILARERAIAANVAGAEEMLDEEDDAGRIEDGRVRLSAREKKEVMKKMRAAVEKKVAALIQIGEYPAEGDGAGEPATEPEPEPEPATPKQADETGTSADEEACDGPVGVRFWLPQPIKGACSAVVKFDAATRHQYVGNSMMAHLVQYSPRLDEKAIFFHADAGLIAADSSKRGAFLARSLFAPEMNGLVGKKGSPTSSGSVLVNTSSVVYNYEDVVEKNEASDERKTVRPGDVKEKDVVFVGVDPGINQTLTCACVCPVTVGTGTRPDVVQTYEWGHCAVSARTLSEASSPARRAKKSAEKRGEAEAAALEEAEKETAIALAKSERAVDAASMRAFAARDVVYRSEAKRILRWIAEFWREQSHTTDPKKYPAVIMAIGKCGIAKGRGWQESPLKSGVPRTSAARLLLAIRDVYPGRLEIDLVEESMTSALCPGCNEKLSNFRQERLRLPAEGAALEEVPRRNGRICCSNEHCPWRLNCENRDVAGAVNMLRRFYKESEDDLSSGKEEKKKTAQERGWERALLRRALKDALNITNPRIDRTPDEFEEEDDVDTDDEVLEGLMHLRENPSLAERGSPTSVEAARAIRDIASTAKKQKETRQRTPGSTPDRDAALRVRVRSPQTESERPESPPDERDEPNAPRRLEFT
jgi:hypothetical protein